MPDNQKLAVVCATLIDGTGRPPLTPATVIIEADRVADVGPAATTPGPAGSTVIDGRGRVFTPGLVDMHVHADTPEKGHPELFLAAGGTTVVDLGGVLDPVVPSRAAVA